MNYLMLVCKQTTANKSKTTKTSQWVFVYMDYGGHENRYFYSEYCSKRHWVVSACLIFFANVWTYFLTNMKVGWANATIKMPCFNFYFRRFFFNLCNEVHIEVEWELRNGCIKSMVYWFRDKSKIKYFYMHWLICLPFLKLIILLPSWKHEKRSLISILIFCHCKRFTSFC